MAHTYDQLSALGIAQDKEILHKISDTNVKKLVTLRSSKRLQSLNTLKEVYSSRHTDPGMLHFIDKLNKLTTSLTEWDTEINNHMLLNDFWSYEEFPKQSEICESYLDKIDKAIKALEDVKKTNSTSSGQTQSNCEKLNLPPLELPKFDGEPENYHRFIKTFESLTSQCKTVTRYNYLLRQLSGPAKRIVESVGLKDLTYESAKKLLDEQYVDKAQQQHSVIKKLVDLKLGSSSEDAYQWISESRILTEQVHDLKFDIDTFLQYFMWDSLNDKFRNELRAVTGKTKLSCKEIIDNAYEANVRYQEICKSGTSKKQKQDYVSKANTASYAANLQASLQTETNVMQPQQSHHATSSSSKKTCLCGGHHKLYFCKVFPEAADKVNKLKQIGGCIKCSNQIHNINQCRSTLRMPCSFCNGDHLSYLCVSKNKKDENAETDIANASKKPKAKVASTASHLLTFSNSTLSTDVILPTATLKIINKKHKRPIVRILKDTAAQSTFIETEFALKNNCKTISDNIEIQVDGFNKSETYKTKIVEIKLLVPGQGTQAIQAICVPKISIKLTIPSLKEIAKELQLKNYQLADRNLIRSNTLDDIKIILGADNAHILPISQHCFGEGKGKQLTYLDSPAGIMLLGKASELHNYLGQLPIKKKE